MGTRVATRSYIVFALLVAFVLAPGMSLPSAQAEEELVSLEIGDEDVEVEFFLRAIQKATGRHMIWNPQDKNIRGKKIIGGVSMRATRDELFDTARALLAAKDLVMVPLGSQRDPIYNVMDARQTSAILRLKPESIILTEANLADYEGKDGLFVTTTIEVEHMGDLRNARNALTRMVTGSNIGNVTEVPAARAIVVTDFAPNVVAVYRTIKRMDRPEAAAPVSSLKTVAIALEHADAHEAASTLAQLFAGQHTAPQAGRVTRTPPPTMPTPPAPRIVADGRTNRLLVSGTADAITRVREAVALVDIPVPQASTEVVLVWLEHADAEEMAGVLMNLIRGSAALWRHGPQQTFPTVVAVEEGNGLLVSAAADHIRAIEALIGKLDRPVAHDDDEDGEDDDER